MHRGHALRLTREQPEEVLEGVERGDRAGKIGERPPTRAYLDAYVGLARRRLPQLAAATVGWWLEERPFFGGLRRQRIWTFWRRVLHTCHHRTQVQTWLRLAEKAEDRDDGK